MTPPASPTAADRLDRTRLAGIAAAIGAISAVGTSVSLAMPLLAIVMELRGYSSFTIGVNTAAGGIASLLSTPFIPWAARRMGAAWLLLASVILGTLIFPLFYVFEGLVVWFVLRFVFSVCLNGAFILSEYWINALAPAGKRGLVMGIYGTILSFGFAVGPGILAVVGSEGPVPFIAGTLILGLSILPVLAGLGAKPPSGEGQGKNFLHYLTVVPLSTFAAFAMGSCESSIMSLSAVYGLRLGYPEAQATLLVVAVAVGNIAMQLPLGLISDRVDRRKLMLAIGSAGVVLAAVVPLISGSLVLLLPVVGLWGGIAAGLYTVGLTHLGARLTGPDLASANAAFVFMYGLGMLIGPALTGLGMDAIGPHGFVVVTGAILLSFAIFAAIRIRKAAK